MPRIRLSGNHEYTNSTQIRQPTTLERDSALISGYELIPHQRTQQIRLTRTH